MAEDLTKLTINLTKFPEGDAQQDKVIETAELALEKYKELNEVASFVVAELNKTEKHWHCIVGQSFGCRVTHEDTFYINFSIGSVTFQIHKTSCV